MDDCNLITKMLNKNYKLNSLQGYRAEDYIIEDLIITPNENGEYGTFRQCLNFELSGKGFQLLNMNNPYIKTRTNNIITEEKNITSNQELKNYIKKQYGLDI